MQWEQIAVPLILSDLYIDITLCEWKQKNLSQDSLKSWFVEKGSEKNQACERIPNIISYIIKGSLDEKLPSYELLKMLKIQ